MAPVGPRAQCLCALVLASVLSGIAGTVTADGASRALEISQAAIGNTLPDTAFTDAAGTPRRLSEFRGKPVLVNLIFTSCAHSCSVSTRFLGRTVQIARDALGPDAFTVLTVGFDTVADTPAAMRAYASRHGISDPRWHFLSTDDPAAMSALIGALGFHYEVSPRGFDHTAMTTIIDRDGVVRRHVYGESFSTPSLVEPLKQMVFGRPMPDDGAFTRLGNRIRLFCTVYDARSDRYHFDYSLFIGIAIGLVVLGSVALWLADEFLFRRRRRAS